MAAYPASQLLIVMPTDWDEVNATVEARYIRHMHERQAQAEKSLAGQVYDALHEACDLCASERIEVRYDIDPGVVRVAPCRDCRRGEFAAFMSKLADEACPPTLPTGERFADGLEDPWDLDESELNPPMVPTERAPYVADRSAYDPHDDRADLEAWSKTTKYPW